MKKYFKVTKHIEIDIGHRVPHHASKCCNVHGHREKIEVDVEGELIPEGNADPAEGMVMDFGDIKKALMEEIHDVFDHRFIMWYLDEELDDLLNIGHTVDEGGDNRYGSFYKVKGFGWVQEIKCVPTAENLAYLFYEALDARLSNERCRVLAVRVHETPTSVAEYYPPPTRVIKTDEMGYVRSVER